MDKKARIQRVRRLGTKALTQGLRKTAQQAGFLDKSLQNIKDFGGKLKQIAYDNPARLLGRITDDKSFATQAKQWWDKASGVKPDKLTPAQKQQIADNYNKLVMGMGAAGLGLGALAAYGLSDKPTAGSLLAGGTLGALALGGGAALVGAPGQDGQQDIPVLQQIANAAGKLRDAYWPFEGWQNAAALPIFGTPFARKWLSKKHLASLLNSYQVPDKIRDAALKLPWRFRKQLVARLVAMQELTPEAIVQMPQYIKFKEGIKDLKDYPKVLKQEILNQMPNNLTKADEIKKWKQDTLKAIQEAFQNKQLMDFVNNKLTYGLGQANIKKWLIQNVQSASAKAAGQGFRNWLQFLTPTVPLHTRRPDIGRMSDLGYRLGFNNPFRKIDPLSPVSWRKYKK